MRKHLLSVVALASIFVLVGCNTNKTSSSSPAVSSSSPKISSSTTTTVDVTGVTLDKTTAELVVGGTVTLTATVAPTTATDKTVTWASSDATVASVADGVVTAVKAGTANITATSGTQVATCAVTVKSAMPSPTKTTIAALNALTADDTTHLYEVTGILEDKSATDKYGNGYLTDATTGETIKIYGSTTTASAITFTDNALGFTNPKDAVTTLADYANGESVTLHCIYKYYNSTPEIMGIMTAHAATTNKYSVTKEAAENGTFVTDKETYSYGETVTVTATPASGYKVGSVEVKNAQDDSVVANVSASDVNVYTFVASCVNNITVNFKEDSGASEYLTFDFETLTATSGDGYATDKGDSSTAPAYNATSKELRLYCNAGATGGFFYTTVTTSKDIASVTVSCYFSGKGTEAKTSADLFVSSTATFGTTAEASKEITATSATDYTFTVTTAGSRFIKILNNGTATTKNPQLRIKNIAITLKA